MEDIGDKIREVALLEDAIKNRQELTCTYNTEEYSKTFALKPLKIVNYEGFWYLVALDSSKDKLRKFYLKNIKNITLVDKYFESTERLDNLLENSISVWFSYYAEPYRVTLAIAKEVAKYFQRKPISKTQKIESVYEDGSMDVSVEITNDMEIITLVKYWVPHIRVIEPTRIQEEIKKELLGYIHN